MLLRTHVTFAVFLTLILLFNYPTANLIQIILLVILGAILPDIDTKTSKIGSKMPMISMLFEHRGFFHSINFIIFLLIIGFLTNTLLSIIWVCIGVFTHLFLDALTKKGIKPFLPLSFRIGGIIKTGGFMDKLLFVIFASFSIIFGLIIYS
ncbi:metal-dependent hydrolase [Candidatus Woesearchaeota archaeon]|nr:MAG: metal-dependent hydrolase [Candidatus Woesearchaeota archaeon]